MIIHSVIKLAQQLIQLSSITPNDAGCQTIIRERLQLLNFHTEIIKFGTTSNLWAYRGKGTTLALAGHTDVVPTGNLKLWKYPPFKGTISKNILYGRGSVDMKGALAAMIIAAEKFVTQKPNHKGRLAFLITSDEEGSAKYGTKKIIEILINRKEIINYCLLGEPSSYKQIGDTIKHGRRGSLTGTITIYGTQGHVAYPHLAKNPIHLAIIKGLKTLILTQWDSGNAFFPATTMQITKISSGINNNIIPNQLIATFNFRFNNISTADNIKKKVHNIMQYHKLIYKINWDLSAQPYLSKPGKLSYIAIKNIKHYQKIIPKLETGGGTSDGRFISKIGAEIIELGAINKTIHKTNECTNIQDLKKLSQIYQGIIQDICS